MDRCRVKGKGEEIDVHDSLTQEDAEERKRGDEQMKEGEARKVSESWAEVGVPEGQTGNVKDNGLSE